MEYVGAKCEEKNHKSINQLGTICLHTFSDLSHTSPAMFVYLLKECYVYGTVKATMRFRILRQLVLEALHNSPPQGPACFIIHCLYIAPLLGPMYTEGFSHLLISSLRHLQTVHMIQINTRDAKHLAAQLLLDILSRSINHEERILLKVLEVFKIELKDIFLAIYGSDLNDIYSDKTKSHIGHCIANFVESKSYMTAMTLLEQFSICLSGYSGQSFLDKLIQEKEFRAAEKWAMLMGKPILCLLVEKYLEMKMLKQAYTIIKNNDLKQDFPHVHDMYKRSSMKKLAEKGCWDIAELRANNDQQHLEYLVCLAIEAGYSEKVNELCERYSLSASGFQETRGPETCHLEFRYLHVKEFVSDDILWVDDICSLHGAMTYICNCKVIGIDCEWKPNYVKGSKPNKVSIMQIASEKKAFVFDLIKLYNDEKEELDKCLKSIFHSSNILKIGYNFHCDLRQLSNSYGDLECFRYYEMLLDVQKLHKECQGGLSELSKAVLGAGLNKTRRNSNWERRPLSQNQIEYAALDAVVLVHIFHHAHSRPSLVDVKDKLSVTDWKSHIVGSLAANSKGLRTFVGL